MEVMPIETQELISRLNDQNPWWNKGEVPERKRKQYKRNQFHYLTDQVEESKITGIIGPRRVGKTISIHQVIEYLLEENINPERILYLTLDNRYLVNKLEEPIKEIFETYFEVILEESKGALEEPVYIFLDEVQHLEEWKNRLKHWYDQGYNINYVVSGSSSARIIQDSRESLMGRFIDRIMLTLKFGEVLEMKQKLGGLDLNGDAGRSGHIVRNTFKKNVKEGDPKELERKLANIYNFLKADETKLKSELELYLKRGGYPEIIEYEAENGKNLNKYGEILNSYITKTIYEDAEILYGVSNSQTLENVLMHISDNSGQIIPYTDLGNAVDKTDDTVKKYVGYLENTFLVSKSKFYSSNRSKGERRSKKHYVLDPGIRNVMVDSIGENYNLEGPEKGLIAETVAFDHLSRLKFKLTDGPNAEVYYWRDNISEVDLVVEVGDEIVPIEIKYKNSTDSGDEKGLNRFSHEHNNQFSIMVTKDELNYKEENDVLRMPLWMFCLMC